MFYAILFTLFVFVIVIFYLSGKEERNFATITAKLIDACFSGIGAGIVTFGVAKYITTLIS